MKMRYTTAILASGFVMAAIAADEERTTRADVWRISAGAVYDSGVKTKMHFMPRMPVGTRLKPMDARCIAHGQTPEGGQKTTYVNKKYNKESWIDGLSSSYAQTDSDFEYEFAGETWTQGTYDFELGYAEYDRQDDAYDSDRSAMPGINVELSRNVYHNEEDRWGVDIAFAFQYARRKNAYRANLNCGEIGYYSSVWRETNLDVQHVLDAFSEYPDELSGLTELYGLVQDGVYSRSFGSSGEIIHRDGVLDRTSLHAEGDYENIELMLLARPYYDIYDWLRINGVVGAVVSRQKMDMTIAMMHDGIGYRSDRDFKQWDVYGIAGLGLMLYYDDFTLSTDFMARFLDRDMDIEDRYYKGKVGRGDWMFKLTIGYEF